MGCAAATASHPSASTTVPAPQQHRPAQPSGQHAPTPAPHVQPQAQAQAQQHAANETMRLAPLVKSLVSVQRQRCSVERDSSGLQLKVGIMASVPGEAIVYFQATEVSDSDLSEVTTAKQTQRQRFNASKEQELRFLLTSESMEKALEGFTEGNSNFALLIDLRADSAPSDSIGLQRSELKLPHTEGEHTVHIGKQWVQCGSYIRTLDALYGTLPNPKAGAEATNTGEGEGGDCVICLSKPRDVAILHCRHVCLCTSCAKITSSTWSFQCPVCRGRVAAMVGLDELGG